MASTKSARRATTTLDTAAELLALHDDQAPYRVRRIIAAHMEEENAEAVLYWSLVLKVLKVSGYA